VTSIKISEWGMKGLQRIAKERFFQDGTSRLPFPMQPNVSRLSTPLKFSIHSYPQSSSSSVLIKCIATVLNPSMSSYIIRLQDLTRILFCLLRFGLVFMDIFRHPNQYQHLYIGTNTRYVSSSTASSTTTMPSITWMDQTVFHSTVQDKVYDEFDDTNTFIEKQCLLNGLHVTANK
jgi:hypothetical protein